MAITADTMIADNYKCLLKTSLKYNNDMTLLFME